MSALPYTRFEFKRTLRNRRFFVLSLGFPVVLYFLIAGPQRSNHDLLGSGISAPLYYMVGMVAFGTMSAMLSSGARIADRAGGRLERGSCGSVRCRRARTSARRC